MYKLTLIIDDETVIDNREFETYEERDQFIEGINFGLRFAKDSMILEYRDEDGDLL